MKAISKTLEVTIKVRQDGAIDFEYYEPESRDFYRICTTTNNAADEENRVGSELLSWASLMADELEEV